MHFNHFYNTILKSHRLFFCFWLFLFSFNIAAQNHLETYKKAAEYVEACEVLYLDNIDTLNFLGSEALRLLQNPSEKEDEERFRLKTMAGAYNVLGFYNNRKGNIKEALGLYLTGIDTAENIKDTLTLSELYNNVAQIYADLGAYDKSFNFYSKGLFITIQLDDTENIANSLDNMSFIFQAQQDLDKTLLYREKALEIREKLPPEAGLARSYNNIGLVYQLKGDFQLAQEFYFKSLTINRRVNDLSAIAVNYDNIGSAFDHADQMDSAIFYYNWSLSVAEELGAARNICGANISLSKAYRKLEQFESALEFASKAYTISMNMNNKSLIIYACKELSVIHEKLNNHQKALQFLRTFNTLLQELNEAAFERKLLLKEELLELSVERKIERIKMEQEIAQSKTENQRKLFIYLMISLLVLILILFLFYSLRQKQKLTLSELEIATLKEQSLEEELAIKQRELTSISVRVTQSNQYLEKVNAIINELKQDELNNDLTEKLHDLKKQIKEGIRIDGDWANFQKQFDGVYIEFSKNLKERFPQLTANEIKLCRLMKLNMNSAEIAILLNVSHNTLRSSRYRIHKKMNLEKGTKLQDFLLKME